MKATIHRSDIAKLLQWLDDEIAGDRLYEEIVKHLRSKLDTLMQGAVLQDTIDDFELPIMLNPVTVIACVARYYDVTARGILGRGQSKRLREARTVAMYLCRQLCPLLTMSEIADAFGHRDHTTICYAVRKVMRELRQGKPTVKAGVQTCFKELRGDEVYGDPKEIDARGKEARATEAS